MSAITVASTAAPPFTFQPPPGGDVSLKSCDGTVFLVHSVMLSLSSTVFEGMFGGAETTADTIELAEDAETVSLMLAFIYPTKLPSIDTHVLLEKAMLIGHKYEVQRVVDLIERLFQYDSTLLTRDPLRVFVASAKYGFTDIRIKAAKSLCSNDHDFLSVEWLTRLMKALPDVPQLISLVGAQGIRMKILDDILFDRPLVLGVYPRHSSSHTRGNRYDQYMICVNCWESRRIIFRGADYYYIPGWYHIWATRVRAALLQKPVGSCESYFNISCIVGFHNVEHEACSACVSATCALPRQTMFNSWAFGVKLQIEKAFEVLDVVYSL